MSAVIPFPKKRVPINHVFEALDPYDPTKTYRLEAFRDEEDTAVEVAFCDPPDEDGMSSVRAGMGLNADQCEEFGKALIAAAAIIRRADAEDA